jgi:hypothetical protein
MVTRSPTRSRPSRRASLPSAATSPTPPEPVVCRSSSCASNGETGMPVIAQTSLKLTSDAST